MIDDPLEVLCPACGEPSTVTLDSDDEEQEFGQDCPVCCRPWTVRVRLEPDGRPEVRVSLEGQD